MLRHWPNVEVMDDLVILEISDALKLLPREYFVSHPAHLQYRANVVKT